MERPCAWPMLYLEINGNDDDKNNLQIFIYTFFLNFSVPEEKIENNNKAEEISEPVDLLDALTKVFNVLIAFSSKFIKGGCSYIIFFLKYCI